MVPLLFAVLIAQGVGPMCSDNAAAIASVNVENVAQLATVNQYNMRVTVTNRTGEVQPGNLLQSVEIYRNGTKADQKGIPPLRPGGTYSFVYSYDRSADAGNGTTTFGFQLNEQIGRDGPSCWSGTPYQLTV